MMGKDYLHKFSVTENETKHMTNDAKLRSTSILIKISLERDLNASSIYPELHGGSGLRLSDGLFVKL